MDGGSEFRAVFEAACAEREILLFELPPRSLKLNVRLREWEQVYNHIRPHWALDYLTPCPGPGEV